MRAVGQRWGRGQLVDLSRRTQALFEVLADLHGTDRLVLKASKLDAIDEMKSHVLERRVSALKKLVYDDPTLSVAGGRSELSAALNELEEEIADQMARRDIEERLERKVNERMQERHEEYIREIRSQILKEDHGPETAATLKRYAVLEKLETIRLGPSALERLRPRSMDEVVGQQRAVAAVLSKLSTPFPQHILLYGPPGTGKTTVARLALEAARRSSHSIFSPEAPFVEVDGTTLRWDPREVTNPLLGSVHDPIYQGARRDLADSGVPEPKLGLVTDAHGGVLFIDEIGDLDPILQNKLLKVLEEKRVRFDSSYYDAGDPRVPTYVKKLFEDGAPADFIMIGATTRDPEDLSPALRSRCAEVFFDPLTPRHIETIVMDAGRRLGVELDREVAVAIGKLTLEGRKAVGIVADAYGVALARQADSPVITVDDVQRVAVAGRLSKVITTRASQRPAVGHAFGLGVAGYVGSVIEIEAVAFPARTPGQGTIRFNETAGSMARDSVHNVASALRAITGHDVKDYDLHVNIIGGGRIDGPSAGLPLLVAVVSAVEDIPVPQDVAMTGEVSLRGGVKPVGGVHEKVFGARQAGMTRVLLPAENADEVAMEIDQPVLVGVSTAEEALAQLGMRIPTGERPASA